MIRTAYYSYWTGGIRKRPSDFALDAQRVSLHCARSHFDKIHLITDSEGVDFFKEMAFDSISTELDCLDAAYEQVWSLGKLLAYKVAAERGEPFLHIDYDVFLWNHFPKKFFNASLLAQQKEWYNYYLYDIQKLVAECPRLHLIDKHRPNSAYNAGILGGHDLEFLKIYAEGAMAFVLDPANKDFMTSNSTDCVGKGLFPWKKACIAEQYYLEVCRLEYAREIEVLTERDWVGEEECKQIGFTHLIASKFRPEIQGKVHILAKKIAKFPAVTKKEPLNLCVGAIFHNEAPTLKEWIEHYLKRGVEHFYLINDGSTDDYQKVLQNYAEHITLFHVLQRQDYNRRQIDLYNFYFLDICKNFKWFLLCDLDEFVWSPQFYSLRSACDNMDEEGIKYASIPMMLYGSNSYSRQPESVVQAFTRRSKMDAEYVEFLKKYSQHKPLARSEEIHKFGIHHMEASCGKTYLSPSDSRFRLNHYRLQSEERWMSRLVMPDVNCFTPADSRNLDAHSGAPVPINSCGNYRTIEMFHEFNKTQNAVLDLGLALQN